jgi:hypothetical protein
MVKQSSYAVKLSGFTYVMRNTLRAFNFSALVFFAPNLVGRINTRLANR